MLTWRRVGFSVILTGAFVLATVLPGCGGGNAGTPAPSGEVQIVPPTDAKGKSYPVSEEGPIPSK